MHHVFNFGMGHTKLAKETARFRTFFSTEGKKLVMHHQLEIMARGNNVQCCLGGHKEVSLRELDARMSWFEVDTQGRSGENRPGQRPLIRRHRSLRHHHQTSHGMGSNILCVVTWPCVTVKLISTLF